jgi:hypothetical protein
MRAGIRDGNVDIFFATFTSNQCNRKPDGVN